MDARLLKCLRVIDRVAGAVMWASLGVAWGAAACSVAATGDWSPVPLAAGATAACAAGVWLSNRADAAAWWLARLALPPAVLTARPAGDDLIVVDGVLALCPGRRVVVVVPRAVSRADAERVRLSCEARLESATGSHFPVAVRWEG